MSEKEKKVIEELKRTIKNSNYCDSIGIGQIEIVLNYIDKLQKEIEEYQELTDNLRGENAELRDDLDKLQKELKDSINARFELQRRIDKTQKENEALGRTLDDEIADNDRLQKENAELKEEIKDLIEENHKHIDYIANMKKKHEDKKKADMNKLINYIAVRENKTHEEVEKEFELGE